MGRKTLERQFEHALHDQIRFGESRHKVKNNMRNQLGHNYKFGMAVTNIQGVETFDRYLRVSQEYAKWLVKSKGVNKYTKMEDTKAFAKDYIKHRLDSGVSAWTAKMEKSALGKLYKEQVNIEIPKRDINNISRSRNVCEHDKHFSIRKHHAEILIANSCGTRREDLSKLTLGSFKDINGHLFVQINQSKGGRDRLAPVLPSKEEEVRGLIKIARQRGKTDNCKLFEKIHSKMDVHSFRREYAKELYNYIKENKDYRIKLLNIYPQRNESKAYKNKITGIIEIRKIKSDYFRAHGDNEVYLRDNLYLVSQSLGHSRIDVSYHFYIK